MTRQGTGRLVKTRLYMEGRLVENGFVSVMVQAQPGSPAMAQIEIVPTNTAKHIMPGTWVHVFTTDPWDPNPAGDLSDFKLLCEGVVVAIGSNKTPAGRNFVLQCMDPSIFWTKAKQMWLNVASADGGLVDQLAVQTSGGYGRFGTVSSTGSYGYMMSQMGLLQSNDHPEERFMDTLISVLDDIGNVNPFYTNARNRFRLTDRIIKAPAGNTVKLFQLALLSDFLEGLAGRVSGQSDLVEVVNQLLSAIFHEWVPIIAPPYVKAQIFDRDVFGNLKRTKKQVAGRGPRGRDTVTLFETQPATDTIVASFMFKPHVYTVSPPTCNVLFPNMYNALPFQRSFLDEPTRLSMKPQLPLVGAGATQGLLLQRPSEIEIFTSLVRDPKRNASQLRTPDGHYADGSGQVPTFSDFDWTTNDERIRGIVYNFINLAPAPSTLTLTDPGARQPSGTRKGGIPKYLQNVASYEFYKSKFASRATEISGPYNMRPVVGFPIVALDDSAANINLVAELVGIVHNINANGNATTSYNLQYTRLADEIDYNRPKFATAFNADGSINLDLLRDDDGTYHFERLFDGVNQPPIPEWFDASFRNIVDLDIKYREWFGDTSGVMQNLLFKNPGNKPDEAAIAEAQKLIAGFAAGTANFSDVGAALRAAQTNADQFEKILEENENISILVGITELNRQYREARDRGKEFDLASQRTQRGFTKIDEAFKFIGAGPIELTDPVTDKAAGSRFSKNPATGRVVSYVGDGLKRFVGDTTAGYGATPDGGTPPAPQTAAAPAAPVDQMSGAFPVFDTTIHTGTEATDQKTRTALLTGGTERGASTWPRFDGRPVMYDFEFRLWQQSLHDAGLSPTGTQIDVNTLAASFVTDANGNVVRPKTPEETVASLKQIKDQQAAQNAKTGGSKAVQQTASMSTDQQAPTGDGLEKEERLPLPQPLSEKQIVDLRRAIIDAYCDELARTRGFTG